MPWVNPLKRGTRVVCQSVGPRINGYVVGCKIVVSRGVQSSCGTKTFLPWHRVYVVMDKVRGRVVEVSEDWVFPTSHEESAEEAS